MKLFPLSLVIILIFLAQPAQAAFQVPSCSVMEKWIDRHLHTVIENRGISIPDREAKTKLIRQEQEALFDDAETNAVFGRPHSEWNPDQARDFLAAIQACKQQVSARGDALMNRKMTSAVGYVHPNKKLSSPAAPNYDKASVQDPGCARIYDWTDVYTQAQGISAGQRVKIMLSHGETVALFQHPYSQWQLDDFKYVTEMVRLCGRGATGEVREALNAVATETRRVMNNMRGSDAAAKSKEAFALQGQNK